MLDSQDIKIAVASHKPYWMPNDSMYLPVYVGSHGNEDIPGFQRDDDGENISYKNNRYCELTALYWAWKNLDSEYVGLAHYRRYLGGDGEKGVLSQSDAEKLLERAPVILPKKRRYYIETVADHYAHTFDQTHLDVAREVIMERSPEMINAFDAHMAERCAHIWNMLIMKDEILNEWCDWLFPVLDEVEKKISFDEMTPFEERVIGRVSERLLDPWLNANGISYTEAPVVNLERTNWLKKACMFLMAKYGGKKYQESF